MLRRSISKATPQLQIFMDVISDNFYYAALSHAGILIFECYFFAKMLIWKQWKDKEVL